MIDDDDGGTELVAEELPGPYTGVGGIAGGVVGVPSVPGDDQCPWPAWAEEMYREKRMIGRVRVNLSMFVADDDGGTELVAEELP